MGRGSHPVAVLFLSVVLLGFCAYAARLPELERLSEVPAGDGAVLKYVGLLSLISDLKYRLGSLMYLVGECFVLRHTFIDC